MAKSEYAKPYFDSNCFIGWIKGEVCEGKDRKKIMDHLLRKAAKKEFMIYTSTLTLAEVHKLKRNPTRLEASNDEKILDLLQSDIVQLITVDRSIGLHANQLCREHGIDPNDAIHLACALKAKCDVLLAWDKRFLKVTHPHLRMEEPKLIGQLMIDESEDVDENS